MCAASGSVGTWDRFDAGSASRAPGAPIRDSGAWSCEEEYVPAAIDSWARGAVPTKKRPVPLEPTPADIESAKSPKPVSGFAPFPAVIHTVFLK